ncbi:phosphoribosylanthranilate isomerase [Telmatospirillum siberiense]|uniref:N-(5'-phosphoribosyl)anthranilate isomerase n=1 Tax=Telmatospirillum siberiense TaxID=382514 RepID=A0A2N3PSM8_9PROT|nr:phosphoribosylanthranilate isomerase [Telmatospirillum siberiense]PKU23409.1 phosphoribosylanthranilate isomerase [Telmatospirillum siberiense]
MSRTDPVKVKICGLTDEDAVEAALEAGADFLGVVFFDKSPRGLSPLRAAEILQWVPEEVRKVGLFVEPDDALLNEVMNQVRLDFFQLHGAETPERVEQVRQEFGMPVIKAVGISAAADLDAAAAYAEVADWLMFDAKAPAGASRPGGNAQAFDWSILKDRKWPCPWFLAGGLTEANVAEAIRLSGAKAVDVSSGVESAPGVKDADLIAKFIAAAKGK